MVDKSSLFETRTDLWLDGALRTKVRFCRCAGVCPPQYISLMGDTCVVLPCAHALSVLYTHRFPLHRAQVGDDKKVSTLRGWYVGGSFVPPADAPVPRDSFASLEGTLVYIVDLPDGLGRTIELRRREGDTMVVRSEVYSSAGDLRMTLTRVWLRAPADSSHVVRIPPLPTSSYPRVHGGAEAVPAAPAVTAAVAAGVCERRTFCQFRRSLSSLSLSSLSSSLSLLPLSLPLLVVIVCDA